MTSEQLPPALAERLAQLERKVRSARLTVLIWVALALLLMWMRFYDRDVILSNKVSQTTAALETVASGKTGLYLFDPQHTIRAELDNRSVSFVTDFPSANLLLSQSIQRAVVIQSVGDQPQADLAHTLRRWQAGGIEISLKRLEEPGPPAACVVGKPSRFDILVGRFLALLGLRRNPLGGFGGSLPAPSSG